jgi:peptidoglycan/xylan/chitin deacetylase (PgdA/CDA1 family)
MEKMHPHARIPYTPITERPPLRLPGDARVAVWLIVNVEEWAADQPMPRTVLTPPAGGVPTPDVPNWAWHEYGNRVGFWRIAEIIDGLGIPAVLAINGKAITTYPQITQAALARDWEFIGHGFTQKNMQKVDDEREDIRLTTEAIASTIGRPPRGWLGPGLTETWETPEILEENGYEYVCDWVLDDQPVSLKTAGGSLTSVPYTQECNDVAMMLIQHHAAAEYRQRAIDQFEQIHHDAEASDSARVMALVVHPYIMGAPHRARYLREALEHIDAHPGAVFMTGSQIVDWYSDQS